ncbi:hypothetical protein M8494_27070 [Serratia ureilytica]
MSIKTQPISLTFNQKQYGPIEVPGGLLMIDFLHEYLGRPARASAAGRAFATPAWRSSITRAAPVKSAHHHHRRISSTARSAVPSKATREWTSRARWLNCRRSSRRFWALQLPVQLARRASSTPPPAFFVEKLKREPIAREQLESAIEQALDSHICRCTGLRALPRSGARRVVRKRAGPAEGDGAMKKRLAVLILLVAIVVIALLWWRENRRYDGPVQQVTAGARQIARGRAIGAGRRLRRLPYRQRGAPLAGGYPAGNAVPARFTAAI